MFTRRPSPLVLIALVGSLVAGGFAAVRITDYVSAPSSASLVTEVPSTPPAFVVPSPAAPSPSPSARLSPSPKPKPKPKPAPVRVALSGPAVLRGLSAWIDVYDYNSDTPVAAAAALVDAAHAGGATTVWIEPSRYKTADIWAPAQLGAMLDRSAALGMPVVLWTLPGFISVDTDVRQAVAAQNFHGPSGGRASAVALDIEVSSNAEPAVRSQRLVAIVSRLKTRLTVPLISITPNPVGMQRHPEYWPGFPWQALGRDTAGIAPMGYWSFRGDDPTAYTSAIIEGVRNLTGRPDVLVHPIGGLAEDTTAAGYRAFCATAHRYGVIGAGIYDLRTTQSFGWPNLAGCRTLGAAS